MVQILKDKTELLTRINNYDILILDGYATARMDAKEITAIKNWITAGGIAILLVRSNGIYVYDPGHYKLAADWTNPDYPDLDSWAGVFNISTCETTTNWCMKTGASGTITLSTDAVEGTYSVLLEGVTTTSGYLSIAYNATLSPLDFTNLQSLKFYVRVNATVYLTVAIYDINGLRRVWRIGTTIQANTWYRIALPVNFTHHLDESPDLSQIAYIAVSFCSRATTPFRIWIDWLYAEKKGTLLNEVAGLTALDFRVPISAYYSTYIPASARDGRFAITAADKSTILAYLTHTTGHTYQRQTMYPIDDRTAILLWLVDTASSLKPQPLLAVRRYGSGYVYTINAVFISLYQDKLDYSDFSSFRFINVTGGAYFSLPKFLFSDVLARTRRTENVRIGITDKPILVVTVDEGWMPRRLRPGYYRLRDLADSLGFRCTWFVSIGPLFAAWVNHREEGDAFYANLSAWDHELANHVWNHSRVDERPAVVPSHIMKIQEYIKANYSYVPVGFKAPAYKYSWANIHTLERIPEIEYAAFSGDKDYGFGYWGEEISPLTGEPTWALPTIRYDYDYKVFYLESSHLPLPDMKNANYYNEALNWALYNRWPLIVIYGHRGDWDNDTRYELTRGFLTSIIRADKAYLMTLRQFAHVYLALRLANITVSGNEIHIDITTSWADTNYLLAVIGKRIARVILNGKEHRAFTEHLVFLPAVQRTHTVIIQVGDSPVLPRLIWADLLQTGWLILRQTIYDDTARAMSIYVVIPRAQVVVLKILAYGRPQVIIMDGYMLISSAPSKAIFETASSDCWFYDDVSRTILVKIKGRLSVKEERFIVVNWLTYTQPPEATTVDWSFWLILSLPGIISLVLALYMLRYKLSRTHRDRYSVLLPQRG